MSRFATGGSVIAAAILGAAANSQGSALSVITQYATFGGLAGAAFAAVLERRRGPDGDRRWLIVTLGSLLGAGFGLCVLILRALT